MEFKEQAKVKYDELLKQREEIDKELGPLKKYLLELGVLKRQTKPRKTKPVTSK